MPRLRAISRLGKPSATSASTSCSRAVSASTSGSCGRDGAGGEITASACSRRSTICRFGSPASRRRSASTSSLVRPFRNTRIGGGTLDPALPPWTLANRHRYVLHLAASHDGDRDRFAKPIAAEPDHELLRFL